MGRPIINLTGQKFGLLTVEKLSRIRKGHAMWLCKCDCGTIKEVQAGNLKSGETKACGCLINPTGENSRLYKHGHSRSPEYDAWHNIKARCYNKDNIAFANYGGRGITMCDRWLESLNSFINDVGKRPSPKHSIDRVDTNRNYEPSNIRWTTREVQARNTRVRKDSISGHKGVFFRKKSNKWVCYIFINKKHKEIGRFNNLEDAISARKEAELKYWESK